MSVSRGAHPNVPRAADGFHMSDRRVAHGLSRVAHACKKNELQSSSVTTYILIAEYLFSFNLMLNFHLSPANKEMV